MFSFIVIISSILILVATSLMINLTCIPVHHSFTYFDDAVWSTLLSVVAGWQSVLLIGATRKCYTSLISSSWLLIVSGCVLMCLSGAFVVTFPPYSWAMLVYPVISCIYLVVGRNNLHRYIREHKK